MGFKIFVSYKYADTLVNDLSKKTIKVINGKLQYVARQTKVRDYVDEIQKKIGKDHINLGEKDGESLEDFSDVTIETELKKKICNSSVTIIIISKGMKDLTHEESHQWIPWEIAYSLREVTRNGRRSRMNALLGVVLPDESNSYEWYYTKNLTCNCTTHHINKLFKILKLNMFNIKEKQFRECGNLKIHISDESSFIKTVKWNEFMNANNYNYYIDKAVEIKCNEEEYNLKINVN